MAEGLGVVGAGGDGLLGADGGADGPEVDGGGAVVCDDGVAEGGCGCSESKAEGCEGCELHFAVCRLE